VQCDAVHRSMCSVSQCVAVWPATDTFVPFPKGADQEFQKFLKQLRSFRHAKKSWLQVALSPWYFDYSLNFVIIPPPLNWIQMMEEVNLNN